MWNLLYLLPLIMTIGVALFTVNVYHDCTKGIMTDLGNRLLGIFVLTIQWGCVVILWVGTYSFVVSL